MWRLMVDEDVRADDHARGPSDAPLVIVYADFTCPFCAVAHERLSQRRARRPGGPSLRLHVGLEDVHDLIADLERGFAALAATR